MSRVLLLCVLQILAGSALAADGAFHFAKEGQLRSGEPFRVEILERPFQHNALLQPSDGGLWGTDFSYPKFTVEKFLLMVSGKSIAIPRKF